MPDQIEFVQIFGERNSGTNFLDQLLRRNVTFQPDRVLGSKEAKKNSYDYIFGFKHWFVTDDLLSNPIQHNTLFLSIFRHPLFWLRSMRDLPYQGVNHTNLPVKEFLRKEWYAEHDGHEMLNERDPKTGRRFGNIMQLRSAKINSFLGLQHKVDHYAQVRYEDLLANPRDFFQSLSSRFPGTFRTDLCVQPSRRASIRQKLKTFCQTTEIESTFDSTDRDYIRSQLDMDAEHRLGYEIRDVRRLRARTTNRLSRFLVAQLAINFGFDLLARISIGDLSVAFDICDMAL
jgi:hypothetical protein